MSGSSLDAIQARADATIEEQVAYTHFAYHSSAHQAARQSAADVPVLVGALRDVLALHSMVSIKRDGEVIYRGCRACNTLWPCLTVQEITAHIDTTPKETP